MSKIILIETSTAACSVAICSEGRILAHRESATARDQAARTAPFVKEVLDECGLTTADCDAVCVSAGPGSYTGLRVGVSSAKGLCFAADKPLIAVGTLDILAYQAIRDHLLPQGCKYIVPMIDARRMEVYAEIFDENINKIEDTKAMIIDENSFSEYKSEHEVWLFGDGADKCAELFANDNRINVIKDFYCSAKYMDKLAQQKLENKDFVDVAYFEPFYLKDFVPGIPTVKGLR